MAADKSHDRHTPVISRINQLSITFHSDNVYVNPWTSSFKCVWQYSILIICVSYMMMSGSSIHIYYYSGICLSHKTLQLNGLSQIKFHNSYNSYHILLTHESIHNQLWMRILDMIWEKNCK